MLSEEEKKEMLMDAMSRKRLMDFRRMEESKFNSFIVNGKVDAGKVIKFISEFNKFTGHKKRKFRKIEGEFKL